MVCVTVEVSLGYRDSNVIGRPMSFSNIVKARVRVTCGFLRKTSNDCSELGPGQGVGRMEFTVREPENITLMLEIAEPVREYLNMDAIGFLLLPAVSCPMISY